MAVGEHEHGRGDVLVAHGRKGMLGRTIDGEDDAGKQRKKKRDKGGAAESLAGSLEPAFAGKSSGGGRGATDNWLSVGNIKDDFKEKNIKALVLGNGKEAEGYLQ